MPDPYPPTRIRDDGKHPLAGVRLLPVREVTRVLRSWGEVGGEVEAALAMLRLCAVHRFVVAATASGGANA